MTTITVPRAVLEQALEALEEFGTHYEHCPRYPTWARPELQPPCNCGLDSNVAALRAALAQKEQEPEPPTQAGALHAMKTALWKQEPDKAEGQA